ncbi:MAG TPA: hypothetical protein VNO86_05390 [Candidatus Binatia bacterium]|nr:hypothetical protein [Candidatus Binatia bacterium]
MTETDTERTTLELTRGELDILLTALRLLASTLGREEADELAEVQRLLARLEGTSQGGHR